MAEFSHILIKIMIEEKLLNITDVLSLKVLKDEDMIDLIKSLGDVLKESQDLEHLRK